MAFRMSTMSLLRMSDPKKFDKKLRAAIAKHKGVGLHIAQELDVGISTLKRWIEEDEKLTKFLERTRKAAKKATAA